jgi:hypothetical protein
MIAHRRRSALLANSERSMSMGSGQGTDTMRGAVRELPSMPSPSAPRKPLPQA